MKMNIEDVLTVLRLSSSTGRFESCVFLVAVLQASPAVLVHLDLKVGLDQQAREDLLVYRVIEASLETPEVLDSPDLLASLEIEDSPDQLERLVLRDVLVLPDCLELLDRVQLGLLGHRDLLELQEPRDLPVKLSCLSLQLLLLT